MPFGGVLTWQGVLLTWRGADGIGVTWRRGFRRATFWMSGSTFQMLEFRGSGSNAAWLILPIQSNARGARVRFAYRQSPELETSGMLPSLPMDDYCNEQCNTGSIACCVTHVTFVVSTAQTNLLSRRSSSCSMRTDVHAAR
eukprot:5121356-Pyramimonas_sp.AAC.2